MQHHWSYHSLALSCSYTAFVWADGAAASQARNLSFQYGWQETVSLLHWQLRKCMSSWHREPSTSQEKQIFQEYFCCNDYLCYDTYQIRWFEDFYNRKAMPMTKVAHSNIRSLLYYSRQYCCLFNMLVIVANYWFKNELYTCLPVRHY